MNSMLEMKDSLLRSQILAGHNGLGSPPLLPGAIPPYPPYSAYHYPYAPGYGGYPYSPFTPAGMFPYVTPYSF